MFLITAENIRYNVRLSPAVQRESPLHAVHSKHIVCLIKDRETHWMSDVIEVLLFSGQTEFNALPVRFICSP